MTEREKIRLAQMAANEVQVDLDIVSDSIKDYFQKIKALLQKDLQPEPKDIIQELKQLEEDLGILKGVLNND